jgi:uncharacterized membrane protein
MKIALRLAALFAFLAILPGAHATDATGTWKGAVDFEGSSVPLTFHLTVAGTAVTGTVEGLPTTPANIFDGKVEGDTVTFSANTDYQGDTYKLVFKGKVSDGQIEFNFGTDDGSWSAMLTAKSAVPPAAAPAPSDVSGTWTGAFDYEQTSVPLTLHLTVAGTAVTGTVEGLPTTPADIHDGKVEGDTVTFSASTDYQGDTYKLVFKGKVSGGQIEFSLGTDDGSWGTTMTAKKGAAPVAAPALADVSGTWKGAFDFQETSVPLTFHLTVAGTAVTGTVEGLPTTPADIHDGKVDGNTVTFSVTTDYQGSPVKLVYTGKVTAKGIDFTFGTEDGSWGTELTATKGA